VQNTKNAHQKEGDENNSVPKPQNIVLAVNMTEDKIVDQKKRG